MSDTGHQMLSSGVLVRRHEWGTEVVLNSGAVVPGAPAQAGTLGAAEQRRTAETLGYGVGPDAVLRMVLDHDPLHAMLCAWLGVPSRALQVAAGELSDPVDPLACLEEDAVLAVQRFMVAAGAPLPGRWLP